MTTIDHRDPAPEDDVLPLRFSQNFRRALAAMPYAAHPSVMRGDMQMGSYRDPLRGAQVIEALEALAVVLRAHVEEHNALDRAHSNLTSDVEAMRRVLGIPSTKED